MKTLSRIPAEQVSGFQVWKLPSLDNTEKIFKVQKHKAGRFTPEERKAHKKSSKDDSVQPQREQSDCSTVDPDEINESGPASDPAGSADAAGKVTDDKEGPNEPDSAAEIEAQAAAVSTASAQPNDAYQQGKEEGFKAGKAEGRKVGLQQGIEQGKQNYADEVKQKIHTLDSLINQLRNPMMQKSEDLSESIAHLVMEISRRVVMRELESDKRQIVNVVSKTLDALPHGANSIKIFLAPADIRIIEQMAQANSGKWQLIEDPNLSVGGCRIETSTSFVDYTLEKRFNDCLDAAFGTDLGLHAAPAGSAVPAPRSNPPAFTGLNTASFSGALSVDSAERSPTERSPTERSPGDTSPVDE